MRFLDPGVFAELEPLRRAASIIETEAAAAAQRYAAIDDGRATPGTWTMLPLLVEPEDRAAFSEAECEVARRLVPQTWALLERVPGLLAAALSRLAPGAHIAEHAHRMPHVSAALGLSGLDGARVTAGGETAQYQRHQWTIFDYTYPHSVVNTGDEPRLVLLVALANPLRRPGVAAEPDEFVDLEWCLDATAQATGRRPVRLRPVTGREGGYTSVVRRVVEFDDGSTRFIKATKTPLLAAALRHEIEVYDALHGIDAPYLLGTHGHHIGADGSVLLVLDNAENAAWPSPESNPWTEASISAAIDTLDAVRSTAPPGWMVWSGGIAAVRPSSTGWAAVADNVGELVGLGLASREWFGQHLQTLVNASDAAAIDGSALVHLDVRSDNFCLIDGEAKLIDWAGARWGHPYFDQHHFALTLFHETGVRRSALLTDDAAGHFAFEAGHAAAAAVRLNRSAPASPAARHVRSVAASRLIWTCELLDIEPPVSILRPG